MFHDVGDQADAEHHAEAEVGGDQEPHRDLPAGALSMSN